MKKVLLTTALLLVMGLQLCFAQKSQSSDYNLRKAYEMLEQKDEKEALKYINPVSYTHLTLPTIA